MFQAAGLVFLLVAIGGARARTPLQADTICNGPFVFYSYNYPTHAMDVNKNNEAYIMESLISSRFFLISPGLNGKSGTVSFESETNPRYFLRHASSVLWLHPYENTSLYLEGATFWPRKDMFYPNYTVYKSYNYPNHYIRHQGYRLKLAPDDGTSLLHQDASFIQSRGTRFQADTICNGPFIFYSYNYPTHAMDLNENNEAYVIESLISSKFFLISPGLNGKNGTVSFESETNPRYFLRHARSVLWLHPHENTRLYLEDATFWPRKDMFYPNYTVYESYNYPNHYIRHQRYRLKISLDDGTSLLHQDASFIQSKEWTTCSKSCGGGNQLGQSSAVLDFCSTIHRGCNTHPCVSAWSQWGPCTKTCGGGTRLKVDKCAKNNLSQCPKTYGDCNTYACRHLSSCPAGHIFRYNDKSQCCKVSKETCGVIYAGFAQRVFGGKLAKLGQWPWAAVMVKRATKTTHCGGSLIHAQWVLTAAHCLAGYKKVNYYVLLGTITIKKPSLTSQKMEIEKLLPHNSYQDPLHDIGLIKLVKKATINTNVRPACLPSGELVQQDALCYVAGWGISTPLELTMYKPSDVLKQAGLRILPLDSCVVGLRKAESWRVEHVTETQHLCVGQFSSAVDTCTGDSGGSVVCQRCSSCGWYLAAITSFGVDDCSAIGVPAVYMNVAKYEHWIRQHLKLSNQNQFVC